MSLVLFSMSFSCVSFVSSMGTADSIIMHSFNFVFNHESCQMSHMLQMPPFPIIFCSKCFFFFMKNNPYVCPQLRVCRFPVYKLNLHFTWFPTVLICLDSAMCFNRPLHPPWLAFVAIITSLSSVIENKLTSLMTYTRVKWESGPLCVKNFLYLASNAWADIFGQHSPMVLLMHIPLTLFYT